MQTYFYLAPELPDFDDGVHTPVVLGSILDGPSADHGSAQPVSKLLAAVAADWGAQSSPMAPQTSPPSARMERVRSLPPFGVNCNGNSARLSCLFDPNLVLVCRQALAISALNKARPRSLPMGSPKSNAPLGTVRDGSRSPPFNNEIGAKRSWNGGVNSTFSANLHHLHGLGGVLVGRLGSGTTAVDRFRDYARRQNPADGGGGSANACLSLPLKVLGQRCASPAWREYEAVTFEQWEGGGFS